MSNFVFQSFHQFLCDYPGILSLFTIEFLCWSLFLEANVILVSIYHVDAYDFLYWQFQEEKYK